MFDHLRKESKEFGALARVKLVRLPGPKSEQGQGSLGADMKADKSVGPDQSRAGAENQRITIDIAA
jgi:hypothetical protein